MPRSESSLDISKQIYEIEVLIKSIEKNSESKNHYGDDFFSIVAKISPYYTNQTTFRVDVPFEIMYSVLFELKKFYENKLLEIHNENNPEFPMVDMIELVYMDKKKTSQFTANSKNKKNILIIFYK